MSWLQIAALAGVAVFALIRFGAFRYIKPAKKTKESLEYTLKELAPKCDVIEDFKAWKRLIDLTEKNNAEGK
jgi:hypothetical protein